jgi:DNA polymerase-3 subunit delta
MNKSLYLFYGEEDFLIDEKIRTLKNKFENPTLNIEVIGGENLSSEQLSSALQTSPLLGGDKLVIIRDLAVDAGNQEDLISAIKNIPAGVTVVIQSPEIDKRSKFYKLVDETGEVVEFKTFAPWEANELTAWIKDRARKSGAAISEAAARRLLEISGNNLRLLASEIEKLSVYIGERKEIGEEDVSQLASPGEVSAFDLLDALRKKDLKGALSLFQNLLRNKEDLFQLLSLLTTQYRLMLQIKALSGKEKDAWKVAKMVKGSPYFVKKCMEGIGRFTLPELKADMEKLLETGLKLKSGESQTITFELLLTALCGA